MVNIFLICLSLSVISLSNSETVIIGHRGSSGTRPENTLASFEIAADVGAEYVECDLLPTKDHVLVCGHSPEITPTTDVSEHHEFDSRITTKNIGGLITGHFVEDFTLNELRTLKAIERFPFRNHNFDYLYTMPTVEEYLTLIKAKENETGRRIGVYLETKLPSYYRSIGLPLEEKLIELLNKFGYKNKDDPIFIESFEDNLPYLRELTNVSLVRLIEGITEGKPDDSAELVSDGRFSSQLFFYSLEGLKQLSQYANGIGPHKSRILTKKNNETDFVSRVHANGMVVHVWTARPEKDFSDEKQFESFEQPARALACRNAGKPPSDLNSDKGSKQTIFIVVSAVISVGIVAIAIGIAFRLKKKNNEEEYRKLTQSNESRGGSKKKL